MSCPGKPRPAGRLETVRGDATPPNTVSDAPCRVRDFISTILVVIASLIGAKLTKVDK